LPVDLHEQMMSPWPYRCHFVLATGGF